MLLLQELTPHMLNVEIFFMIQLILIWYTTINDTVNLRDQPKFGEKWNMIAVARKILVLSLQPYKIFFA